MKLSERKWLLKGYVLNDDAQGEERKEAYLKNRKKYNLYSSEEVHYDKEKADQILKAPRKQQDAAKYTRKKYRHSLGIKEEKIEGQKTYHILRKNHAANIAWLFGYKNLVEEDRIIGKYAFENTNGEKVHVQIADELTENLYYPSGALYEKKRFGKVIRCDFENGDAPKYFQLNHPCSQLYLLQDLFCFHLPSTTADKIPLGSKLMYFENGKLVITDENGKIEVVEDYEKADSTLQITLDSMKAR